MTYKIFLVLAVCGSLLGFSIPSSAQTYLLQQDLGVHGVMRYCRYSNGKVYTSRQTEPCPMSISRNPPGPNKITGFLGNSYIDGMTRVCFYTTSGGVRSIRIPKTYFCPQTHKFR